MYTYIQGLVYHEFHNACAWIFSSAKHKVWFIDNDITQLNKCTFCCAVQFNPTWCCSWSWSFAACKLTRVVSVNDILKLAVEFLHTPRIPPIAFKPSSGTQLKEAIRSFLGHYHPGLCAKHDNETTTSSSALKQIWHTFSVSPSHHPVLLSCFCYPTFFKRMTSWICKQSFYKQLAFSFA